MKKKFELIVENKNTDRLVESSKNEIRKYIKREKRKALPEGVDFWLIDCKFAQNDDTLEAIAFGDITKYIDAAAENKCVSFTIELLAVEGVKTAKEKEEE